MKTIEKPMKYDHLIIGTDRVEICAFQPCENSNQRLIMWRLAPESIPIPTEKKIGIWPFRKKIVYKYKNPWRRVGIINPDGEEGYLVIGGAGTDVSLDMEHFIQLRKKLKTVENIEEYAAKVSEENKTTWCVSHKVTEFVTIDSYVDEFGGDEVWK